MIKSINALLIPFVLFFNFFVHFKTLEKNDFSSIKYCAFIDKANFSLSHYRSDNQIGYSIQSPKINRKNDKKNDLVLSQKKAQLSDIYLIFTFALALMAIGIEFRVAKSAKIIKKKNETLSLNNKVMLQQNMYLQNALSALEESNVENTRMLQIIAHDLRSPMAAIVGLSNFVIDENKLLAEDMEVISLIHTSGVDSLKFINEILDKETLEMEMQMVDIHQLLNYCVTQLQFKANEKQQHIVLLSKPCTLKLNREKIWRVITNLLSNAIKFSPPKSIITADLQLFERKIVISIKDSGIGIPENLSDKIFTLSSQRKRTGTAGEKSFGMGLSIAKQNVEAHGGILYFKSKEGNGTTFFIEIPMIK
jgi:signal transduction histidine kinase